MSATLQRAWQSRGVLAWLLWPIACVYGGLLWLRRWGYRLGVYRVERLDVPVLVVGNVVVGGAGKTPTVVAVVRHLRQQGWTPGVVSRGHGRNGDTCLEVTDGIGAQDAGDEPLLIARATEVPVVVGRHRVAAGRWLRQQHPEVDIIVCDDGMQHWALARDVTVVVFDERGIGNGWLLPAGLLREPWPTAPWPAGDRVLLRTQRTQVAPPAAALPTGPGAPTVYQAWRGLAPHARDPQGRLRALSDFGSRPVAALAGIAQPQLFFDMLGQQGVALAAALALPDHADAATLLAALRSDQDWLCTEKDAVKLFPLLRERADLRVWTVELEQTPEPGFFTALDRALAHGQHRPRRDTPQTA